MSKRRKSQDYSRPIDKIVRSSFSWWGKNFVFIKKTKLKNWQALLIAALLIGFSAGIIWTIRSNMHSTSDAGTRKIKDKYKEYERKYDKDKYKKSYQIVKEVKRKYHDRYLNMKRIYPVMKELPRPSDNEISQGLGYYPEIQELGYTPANFHQAWKDYNLYRRYKKYKRFRELEELYEEIKEEEEEEEREDNEICEDDECINVNFDLEIFEYKLSPEKDEYSEGEEVEVIISLKNEGPEGKEVEAGVFKIKHGEEVKEIEEYEKKTVKKISMQGGEREDNFSLGKIVITQDLKEDYYLKAIVDPYDELLEIDEYNNSLDISIPIGDGPPIPPADCFNEDGKIYMPAETDKRCCDNLDTWAKGMDTRISVGANCYETNLVAGALLEMCIDCGDGNCSEWENPCNCASDCGSQNATFEDKDEFCESGIYTKLCSEDNADRPTELCSLCESACIGPECDKPDLEILEVEFRHGDTGQAQDVFYAGEPIILFVKVINNGTKDSFQTEVVFIDKDGDPYTALVFPPIAANGVISEAEAPGPIYLEQPGDHHFEIIVDHNEVNEESNEDNNIFNKVVTIKSDCLKEGETYMPDGNKACCDDLEEWDVGLDTTLSIADTCYDTNSLPGSPQKICLDLNNGTCSAWENPCNSPSDCQGGQNADFADENQFCASSTYTNLCGDVNNPERPQELCSLCQEFCADEGEEVYSSETLGPTECCRADLGIKPAFGGFDTETGACTASNNGVIGHCIAGWDEQCGNGVCENGNNPRPDKGEDRCNCDDCRLPDFVITDVRILGEE
ncbi:MAG: hypothetical protein GF347_05170, partial [Candidatus Moranbacteria bacterium]|nr:hypothetical protein [Candidatus Moranbacteria bacterium]